MAYRTSRKNNDIDYRHIYLGTSSRRGLVKIGIATDVPRRWNDIDRSTPGSEERPTFAMPVIWAEFWERRVLHRLFSPWAYRHRGSGKTEWFRFGLLKLPCVAVAVAVILLARVVTFVYFVLIVAWVGLLLGLAAWLIVH